MIYRVDVAGADVGTNLIDGHAAAQGDIDASWEVPMSAPT